VRGAPVPLTRDGQAYRAGEDLPEGTFEYVLLEPGEVRKEIKAVGAISDIHTPGKYTVQVSLVDPVSGLTVKSAPAMFTIMGDVPPSAEVPPFVVTARLLNPDDDPLRSRFPVLQCTTNISDSGLRLANSTDYYEIRDDQGKPILIRQSDPVVPDASHEFYLGPGDSLCGEFNLDGFAGLDNAGKYSVQLGRVWNRPSEVVKSNVITLSVASK
jgi:hypothetical protein